MFSKKATKMDEIFTIDLTLCISVKSAVKISSIFVAFLENTNFNKDDTGCDWIVNSYKHGSNRRILVNLKMVKNATKISAWKGTAIAT